MLINNQFQYPNRKQVVYFSNVLMPLLSYRYIYIYGIILFVMIIICLLYLLFIYFWKFICLLNYFIYDMNQMYMRYIIRIFIHCEPYNKKYVNHTIK